jgi:hypothetical protein
MIQHMGTTARTYFLHRWRGSIAVLLPVLLLLPFFHLHPAHTHGEEPHGAHQHAAVVHVDFLPLLADDHNAHHSDHSVPHAPSSYPLSQISFPTLLPRHVGLSLPVLHKLPVDLPTVTPAIVPPFIFQTWLLPGDQALPGQSPVLSLLAPRAPPCVV